ncbi:MAG: GDP-mannose 4,6-dehydratase [Spirochaetes bacterium]|nr:GDP-mannose 4,6-dehydratase [Spirochaetota bacterium]
MEKVLITGVAGFIGFHAAKKFMDNHVSVIGIDDLNDHYDPRIKNKRLEFLKKNYPQLFTFKKVDITNKKKMESLLKDKYRAIINLAARAGVRSSLDDPWVYFQVNTMGVLNLLEWIRQYQQTTLLIQATTSSIYGDNRVPFSEDDRVDHPLSPYAASKKASEELCYTYHYLYNINALVFRFFTVYGTFGRPDMSIFRFIRWIDEGEELLLYGDGEQKRDFTFVEDVVDALYKGLDFKGYDVINLGNDNPVKMNYVIKQIEDHLGKKARIDRKPRHPADLTSTCARIEKAMKILNWTPQIKIDEGLKKVIEWYQKEKAWVKKVKIEKI